MIGSIRQKTIVREGGWVEIRSPELPIGARVEVIVLVEPEDSDTTEYLLSSEANRQHLEQALKDAEDPANYCALPSPALANRSRSNMNSKGCGQDGLRMNIALFTK